MSIEDHKSHDNSVAADNNQNCVTVPNSGEKENLSWRANSIERCGTRSHCKNDVSERTHETASNERLGCSGRERNWQSERDSRRKVRNVGRDGKERHSLLRRDSNCSSNSNLDELNWRNELRSPTPSSTSVALGKYDSSELTHFQGIEKNGNPSKNSAAAGSPVPPNIQGSKEDLHKPPGILVLPETVANKSPSPYKELSEVPAYPTYSGNVKRQLFNPSNPSEPIIVAVANRGFSHTSKDTTGRMMQSCQQNAENRWVKILIVFLINF